MSKIGSFGASAEQRTQTKRPIERLYPSDISDKSVVVHAPLAPTMEMHG
jgi:hypothetical protein